MFRTVKQKLALSIAALSIAVLAQAADPFPNKPIRVIVHSTPGGLLDTHTRLIAQKMSDNLGQQLIIENRPGGGGSVAFRYLKSVPADGYTLLAAADTVTFLPSIMINPGYDPVKDFTGIGGMTRFPALVMVPIDGPKDLATYIAEIKAKPGDHSYASGGVGTAPHLAAASFLRRAGAEIKHVPYKGNSAAWPDLIAGRVGMLFEPYGTAAGMMKEGRLKALAVSSAARLAAVPDVPTVSELGYPGWNFYLWFGLMAPAGSPKDVIKKLSDSLRTALASPELKDRFDKEGTEIMALPPEELNQLVKNSEINMGKLVTVLKIPKE
jgi:tripartite-type tricarboxylate transporter receptor subunit TctC